MNKQVLILLVLAVAMNNASAQSISLDSCISWANEQQKFVANQALIRQSQVMAMENNRKMNLPRLNLDFNATYQNENITIQVPAVPGFDTPVVPLNFNRLLLNFNQTIYNGRLTAQKTLIDSLTYDSYTFQVEVDRARLKSKITGIYSSIILVKEQREIIKRQIGTVDAKAKQLKGAVDAGVAYRSDLTSLRVEVLNLQQSATDLEYLERSLRHQLSVHTGHTINHENTLELPDQEIDMSGVEARPELQFINSQKYVLGAQSELSSASRMPYVGVFGSAGVGFPGYDIFNPSIRPMLLVGVKVNWKIIDWQKSKNDRQILSWNQDILSYQYDRVKLEFESELVKQKQEIAKYEELITRDKMIVEMRQEVTQDISTRLSGGTATSTDFLIQLNNEAVAELNKSIHLIKLSLAKISYTIIQGK